jgi:hypothetical protein
MESSLSEGDETLQKLLLLVVALVFATRASAVQLTFSPRAAVSAGFISWNSPLRSYGGGGAAIGLTAQSIRFDIDAILGASLNDLPLLADQNESTPRSGFPWHNQIFISAAGRLPTDLSYDLWLGGGLGAVSTQFNGGDVVGIATHPALSFDARLRVPLASWISIAADFRLPLGIEPSMMPSLAVGAELKLGEP